MCKLNKRNKGRRMDPCMEKIVALVNSSTNYKTLACCCAHGKYKMTLVVDNKRGIILDWFSGVVIPRKTKFYRYDTQGYPYIPEVENNE